MRDADPPAHKPAPRVRLVVNADDFGRSEAVNSAVAQAFLHGVLTSASLMVTADAAADAVGVARDNPSLAVGLHLVVVGGRAALPGKTVPHLVDVDGYFSRRPFPAGIRYFFSRRARDELAGEIRAQFEAFRATGLQLSHVDGHHHMHLHPVIFRLLLPLAQEYGACAVRVRISDTLLLSLRVDRGHPGLKLGWKIAFALLSVWSRRALAGRPMPTSDAVFGLMQTGQVTEAYILGLLERLGRPPKIRGQPLWARMHRLDVGRAQAAGGLASPLVEADDRPRLVELFCHPSLRQESGWLGPNPGDLEALASPAVRAAVEKSAIELTTFSEALCALDRNRPFQAPRLSVDSTEPNASI